jgi:hypothetical protein
MTKQDGDVRQNTSSEEAGWIQHVLGPVIVGLIVLAGQGIIAPIVAKSVKTEESILDQRFKAYENAVNVLQRHLAAVSMTGKQIPAWYAPPEKTKPTQVETNVAYNLLIIYGKDGTVSDQFRKAIIGPTSGSVTRERKIDPQDIVKLVSALRKELGVNRKGFTGDDFSYIFVQPSDANSQSHEASVDRDRQ